MSAPAPAGGVRRILRDVAGFATSQYVLRVGNLIKGFAVARVLGPEGNGIWQHFALIFDYAQFTHFGVQTGYTKEIGHRLGRGDEAGVDAARDTGLGGVLVAGLVVWVGLTAYAIFGDNVHPVDRWGLPILGLIVVLEQVTNTYKALMRAYSRIGVISAVSVVFATTNLVLSLALLPGLKMFGLLVAWLITRAATTWWLVHRSGAPFRPRLDPAMLRILIATGFPIFLYHVTRLALRNIDRVLVDTVLDKSDLGIYGIAVTLASLVRYGADAIGFVIYPIFLRLYGETDSPRALRDHLEKPTLFIALFVPMALGLGWLVMHLPIRWLLPEYEASIEVFRLLTVSIVFSCLTILPGFYMMAIDRQNWLVPIGAAAVAFNWFAGSALIEQGYGLPGVAAAMGAGLFLHTTTVLAISGSYAFGSFGAAVAWIARTYGPIAYVAALIAGIQWLGPRTAAAAWGDVARAGFDAGIFLLLTVPLLVAFERRSGFIREMRKQQSRSAAGPPPPSA